MTIVPYIIVILEPKKMTVVLIKLTLLVLIISVGLEITYVGKFMCLLRFMYCYVFWCSSMAFVSYHYWNPVLVLVYICVLYGQYCRLLDGMYTYIYVI